MAERIQCKRLDLGECNRLRVSGDDSATDADGGLKMPGLFVVREDSVTLVFAGQHPYPKRRSFEDAPFERQPQHSLQNLQLTVDAA